MKFLFVSALLLVSNLLSSQTWLHEGTTMHYESADMAYRMVTTCKMIRYVVVNGRVCSDFQTSVMQEFTYSPGPGEPSETQISGPTSGKSYRVHIDGRKYYFVNKDNSFSLIADFLAKEGDTWMVPNLSTEFNSNDSNRVVVGYAGDSIFDGMTHHYLILEHGKPGEEGYSFTQTVVEGIGSMGSPFLQNPAGQMNCNVEFIRCFENDFEKHVFVNGPCDIETGISEHEFQSLIIYPNPVNDVLTINGVKTDFLLEWKDISGRSLKTFQLHTGNNQLDISSLPKGNYLLIPVGVTSGGRVVVKK